MLRSLSRRMFLCLVVLSMGVLATDRGAAAAEAERYKLAAERAGSIVYTLGVGIESLVKLNVLPGRDIDLEVAITSGFLDSFVMVNQGDAHFALLKADWGDLMGLDDDQSGEQQRTHDVEAVATLWQEDGQSIQLVARKDVDEAIVYEVTRAIFENLPFLEQIDESLVEKTSLDNAASDVGLPLHAGARRYFEENAAVSPSANVAAETTRDSAPAPQEAKTFVVYFELDEYEITSEGVATLDELKAFTESLESPKVWIAGYTDTTGSADYNLDLAEKRADAVLAELRAKKIAARNLDVTAFGERSPWVVTSDQTLEARNRRVEILVEPGKEQVVIGRAERAGRSNEERDTEDR